MTQFKPQSDSATEQHLLESNQCERNYSDSRFKILTTARSQFHLNLLEAVYVSRKKQICASKSSSYLPLKCFDNIRACCHWMNYISPYSRLHFFLVYLVFKRSCSPHTKPERDRN